MVARIGAFNELVTCTLVVNESCIPTMSYSLLSFPRNSSANRHHPTGGGTASGVNASLKLGGRSRGAEGAKGVGMGRGYPLPIRLGGLGEHRKLPQWGSGRSPENFSICRYFQPHNS